MRGDLYEVNLGKNTESLSKLDQLEHTIGNLHPQQNTNNYNMVQNAINCH